MTREQDGRAREQEVARIADLMARTDRAEVNMARAALREAIARLEAIARTGYTEMARRRAAEAHDALWKISIWGLGDWDAIQQEARQEAERLLEDHPGA